MILQQTFHIKFTGDVLEILWLQIHAECNYIYALGSDALYVSLNDAKITQKKQQNAFFCSKNINKDSVLNEMYVQGCSHAFDIGGAQASKIIFGPLCLKYWGGPNPTFTIV